MKLTIYNGTAIPLEAIGKNQCKTLEFAEKYQGIHSYNPKDKATINALRGLVKRNPALKVDFVNHTFGLY